MENTFQFPTEYRNDHEWPFTKTNLDNMFPWCQKSDFSSVSGRRFSSDSIAHKNDIPMMVYVFCNSLLCNVAQMTAVVRTFDYLFSFPYSEKYKYRIRFRSATLPLFIDINTISLQFIFYFWLISSSYCSDLIRVIKSHTRNETRLFARKTKNACFFQFVSHFHN